MPTVSDFRGYAFDHVRVDAAGRNIGGRVYWKLYAIENLFRVVVHSVLTAQAGVNWWSIAVDPKLQNQVASRMKGYASRPWHSTPGKHDIYYTLLSDLNKIVAANSHLFKPIIADIDQWIARLEQVRIPRNIVGHMNWPSQIDRQRIDVCYADVQQLLRHLGNRGVTLSVP
jgi:hypothetical protein